MVLMVKCLLFYDSLSKIVDFITGVQKQHYYLLSCIHFSINVSFSCIRLVIDD